MSEWARLILQGGARPEMKNTLWCSLFILAVFILLLIYLLWYVTVFSKTNDNSRGYIISGENSLISSSSGPGFRTNCGNNIDPPNESVGRHLTNLEPPVNATCDRLLIGETRERTRVRELLKKWNNTVSDEKFMQYIMSCPAIVASFKKNFYISNIEKQFPLGFVVLMSYSQHSIQQYIRLLRFLYRPQNAYCIHIDNKSPGPWIRSITEFASCFPNIIIAKNAVEVAYASGAILTAHLNCLKELYHFGQVEWKYVIDLHGTELPLVTNREIVEALAPLNGINAIVRGINTSNEIPGSMTYRKITNKVIFIPGKGAKFTEENLGKVPYNMTLFKSADSPNSAFSREFVLFLLTDKRAIALAKYLQDVLSAVEFYFSTLNNLPDAPGGRREYLQHQEMTQSLVTLPTVTVRYWKTSENDCLEGYYRHHICVVSASDLQWIMKLSIKRKYMFVNKYLIDYDHVVMDCMEEALVKRNLDEYKSDCLDS